MGENCNTFSSMCQVQWAACGEHLYLQHTLKLLAETYTVSVRLRLAGTIVLKEIQNL